MDQMNVATEDRKEFIGILMELSEQLGNQGRSSLIDEQLMDKIVSEYLESNRRFADKYLTKMEAEYFLEPVPTLK